MPTDDAATPVLGRVTHELRTRLAAATAAVEGLRDTTVDWTDEDRRELLALAQTSLENIRLLLAELSAAGNGLSRMLTSRDGGTDLHPLVDAAVAELGEGVRQPRIDVPASLPPVLGDPAVLRLILVSLFRHALREPDVRRLDVRAAAAGHRVLLRAGVDGPVTDGWRRDLPMPAGHADREPPLGADMSVARDLARLLGGTVRAADEARDDRAVVLDLPRAHVPAAEPRAPRP